MTSFNHSKRSGRHKRRKERTRQPMGLSGDLDQLLVHREMEALRRPTRYRLWKLQQVRDAIERRDQKETT